MFEGAAALERFDVMIIDDSPTTLVLLSSMVREIEGVDVRRCSSAARALPLIADLPPDLVLVDYILPEMNGTAFIRQFRSLPRCASVPIIMVTATEARDTLYEALEAGATDFLIKPPDRVELIARVRNFLKMRSIERQLFRLAHFDELTGLANRRRFMTEFEMALTQSQKMRQSLSFAIFDTDHFKRVNDTYGHAMGDEVLRRLAKTCAQFCPSHYLVARLGGEEFGLVMPGVGQQDALLDCDQLRQAVAASIVETPQGQRIAFTISIGVATLTDSDTATTLMVRADRALYTAKLGGRNRVAGQPLLYGAPRN
jgi:diguanylate cyclase (GGDEF)-like protein